MSDIKTAFVGGGPGCEAIMKMILSRSFQSLRAEIVGVMDIDHQSVGCRFAKKQGIPLFSSLEQMFAIKELHLVFELVGSDVILDSIYRLVPAGVRVIDHKMAQVYWELEATQRRFNQVIENAHSAISIKDPQGRYLLANKRTAKYFNLPQDVFIGRTSKEILPEEVWRVFEKSEAKVAKTLKNERVDELLNVNGKIYKWHTERFPIVDRQGNSFEICSISRDITNEERLKEELIQSVKMATLGQLAAGVAHEINNPLTGILSFAENARLDVDDDTSIANDLEMIIRETLRCRQIVRDLLDYSRLSSPQLAPIHIDEVISRVLAIVSQQVAFQDVEIMYRKTPKLPMVIMDPNQAQQVILNLLINAQEAVSAKGRIRISTDFDEKREKVMVRIKDNGCGIDANELGKIFEPFYSSKGMQGNGLGLSVVQRIMEAHQGRIWVSSEPGVGTEFFLEIPADSAED